MTDRPRDAAHERRGMRDGAADGSTSGRHAPRRDEARSTTTVPRLGDDIAWGLYGDAETQPDHGEENG